jgi:hypothetical protein
VTQSHGSSLPSEARDDSTKDPKTAGLPKPFNWWDSLMSKTNNNATDMPENLSGLCTSDFLTIAIDLIK